MGNPRATRQRTRRTAKIKPHEMQWLTGLPQKDVNAFAMLAFELPAAPRDFDHLAAVLDRAELAQAVAAERIAELRAYVAELRARDRRQFPRRPEYTGERIHG